MPASLKNRLLISMAALGLLAIHPSRAQESLALPAVPNWLEGQKNGAVDLLFRNLSFQGAAPGAVIAAPHHGEQNYIFHWVRDAALVMQEVISLFENSRDPVLRNLYRNEINDYVRFSIGLQHTYNRSAEVPGYAQNPPLGEPKFNINGSAFTGDWGRPQNDGPALRALSFMHWARNEQNLDSAPIYADLDFVAKYWTQKSFDLWEETIGYHFYTRMVQRRALIEGARYAQEHGDKGRAQLYRDIAQQLEKYIPFSWDAGRGFLKVTTDYENGNRGKDSDIDAAVVLAALHAAGDDDFYSITSEQILATAAVIESTFENRYAINQRKANLEGMMLSPAIGRYPEDAYNGDNANTPFGGNAWPLLTNAFSELYSKLATEFLNNGHLSISNTNIRFFQRLNTGINLKPGQDFVRGTSSDDAFQKIVKALVQKSDGFLERNRFHAYRDNNQQFSFNEQINQNDGHQQGATDLTWNYASFLSAIEARQALNR